MNIWNPWHGCKKVSEGCRNCYMYYLDKRRAIDSSNIFRLKSNFDMPMKKDRQGHYKVKSGETLFLCLTSDFFIKEADEWRPEIWNMIRKRSDVNFSIITKRPERVMECLPDDWGDGWDNVHFNVTAENQAMADVRIPIMLSLPFRTMGVMATPLLSEINIEKYLAEYKISHVTAGGENYDGARPCRYEWVKSLYDQCVKYRVQFRFDETGAKFIKNGKLYNVPRLLQREQALKSGLNYPPIQGKVVIREKCRSCRNRYTCKGCGSCTKCGPI